MKVQEEDPFDSSKTTVGLNLPTLRGVRRVSEPNYILQKENGSFEIMTAEEFENLYERPTR